MTTPALSVVIPSRSGWRPLDRTLRCLAAQTIADRIELLLVAMGDEDAGEPPAEVLALAAHRVVRAPQAHSVSQANAAGSRHATAPVVVFGEDHAFPVPGWAAALVERHEEDWGVVGPVVRNANPGTLVSWADFAIGYGAFAEGHPGGEVDMAPGHNSSYKRAVLQRHDDELEEALEAEWVFHGRLRAEGERVCLEPRAVIRHVNFGMFRPFLVVTYRHARVAAAARAAAWPAPKRLAYLLASPLIPLVRLVRLRRILPAEQRRRFPRRALPVLFLAFAIDGAAQAAGFARPASDADREAVAHLELERLRFVPTEEVAALP